MTKFLLKILSIKGPDFQLVDKGEFESIVKHYERKGYDVKIIGIGENIRLVNTLHQNSD